VSVPKIASMLEKACENTPIPAAPSAAGGAARFARDPAEFSPHRARLTLIHGEDQPGTSGEGTPA
jgi:hypothetical protein